LPDLEASSTRDEVLAELRKTVLIVLPIAGYIPVMAIVRRLVFSD
jgi:hypothetical protein